MCEGKTTDASITDVLTCTNGGATITASATGRTPVYEYQLEDNVGGVITAYQASDIFTGLAAGDYIIRVRDTYSCEDPIDAAITVVAPTPITFTSTETACYSGSNDGTITIDDALVAIVDVFDVSACADGSITVTASGGMPNLEYAFVPATTCPTTQRVGRRRS